MNTYTYDQIEIGHKESFTVTVTDEEMDKFREITGDINPPRICRPWPESIFPASTLLSTA